MKIVLPVHHFLPRYTAGAEVYTYRLAGELRRLGHEIEVIAVEAIDHGSPGVLDVASDAYDGIPVKRLRFNLMAGERSWEYDNPLIGNWFADYLHQARPDLVHFQAGYLMGVAPLAAAVQAGIPTILTLHDYWFLCPRITLLKGDGSLCRAVPEDPGACAWCLRLDQRRYRLPEQATNGMFGLMMRQLGDDSGRAYIHNRRRRLLPALALPDAVISPSQFLADQVRALVPPERLHVSRLGFDLDRFANLPGERHSEALRIGFIGQIAEHKGVHLLITAFRMLRAGARPLELHIYGGMDAHPAYVKRLRALATDDARIVLHGRVDNTLVPKTLAGFDVAVVPSLWYENAPLAIQEAYAAGTPVVTAAIGGMAELVRDGVDGLHFHAGEARDLARMLQHLIDDVELLPRLRSAVRPPRRIAEEMAQIRSIYDDVITRRVSMAREAV